LDLAPGPRGQAGQVILFGAREDTNYVVAPSWTAFLEHVLFLLESGNVNVQERDAHGFRQFDTWHPGASHFHDYIAGLYKQPGAASDAIPPPGDVTGMLLPPHGRRAYPLGREEEIRQWATGLQHFRFYSSCGGPDEGFGFLISLRCAWESELEQVQCSLSAILEELGIELDEGARFESADGVLSLILSGAEGDSVHVTEADYQNARRLEAVLQPYLDQLIQPPRANVDCVCPEYYAGFWGLTTRPRFPLRSA
ncbi:hypothetical protein, partial [Pyxidicoccus sp. MSG2]|uniref:hypothetical protein n=1 Tax=Pyxidicoccus sp. MSG2 TaxID=2996790 RepID=UPI002270741F